MSRGPTECTSTQKPKPPTDPSPATRPLVAILGFAAGFVARLWLLTIRYSVLPHPLLRTDSSRRWVLALWHGQLFPLMGHRRRCTTAAIVSKSSDGQILAWAMRWFRVVAVRGSSSRGGKVALAGIIERVRSGYDVAFAVDGPIGPRRTARAGALAAAERTGAWVVPYACACSRFTVLRTWDRFVVPWPFCRIVVVLGKPIGGSDERTVEHLANSIDGAVLHARTVLRNREFMVPDEWRIAGCMDAGE